jgi:hypothetical protein
MISFDSLVYRFYNKILKSLETLIYENRYKFY